MKVTPIMYRILLKPKIETETESGIVISYDKRKVAVDCDIGEVVQIGDNAFKQYGYETPPIKIGDLVYYSKYGARVLDLDGELFVACNDEDIILKEIKQ